MLEHIELHVEIEGVTVNSIVVLAAVVIVRLIPGVVLVPNTPLGHIRRDNSKSNSQTLFIIDNVRDNGRG